MFLLKYHTVFFQYKMTTVVHQCRRKKNSSHCVSSCYRNWALKQLWKTRYVLISGLWKPANAYVLSSI